MSADLPPEVLESPEALREVIVGQRRELDALRRETADVALLLDALGALLEVGPDEDPFAGVFARLEPVFAFSHALVLSEAGDPGSPLRCIVATVPDLVDVVWPPGRFLEKVLSGKVTATLTNEVVEGWPAAAVAAGLGPAQPAIYLPLTVKDRRALVVLARPVGDDGFDRRHVALARKFSLLASHAFATRSANRSEHERRRLHDLTEELKAAQARLAHRADHDALTGLPNRGTLEERVRRALDRAGDDGRVGLAFVDLDGFKQVNDRYGHAVGDGLLVAVAERIRRELRPTDVLARISGDEFVILVDPLDDPPALQALGERIIARRWEPVTIDGHGLAISASIGVAMHPEHGGSYDELTRNADMAMYRAKAAEKGSVAWYDVELGREAAERRELEDVIRSAVRDRRIVPVLQPLVDPETLAVTGCEARARRVDAAGRLRPPADFIDVAAQLGLLDAITHLLLDELIDALPALDAAYGDATTLSLNLSARQATDPAAMQALLERLIACGQPDRFVIELTEDAYLQAGVFQRHVLPRFREFGVEVAIDDFGTGYASLSTLLEVSAQELKVDRAFVTGVHERPRSQIILGGIAMAGQALGLRVVAEGVETAEELAHLRGVQGVTRVQGYLFAEPAQIAELIDGRDALLHRISTLCRATSGPVPR